MENTIKVVKYIISVWDDATSKSWRDSPDHVQKEFLEAEKEFLDIPEGARIVVKISHSLK